MSIFEKHTKHLLEIVLSYTSGYTTMTQFKDELTELERTIIEKDFFIPKRGEGLNLWVCTLYPYKKSMFTNWNIELLQHYLPGVNIIPLHIQCGTFTKGTGDNEPDYDEIYWRNKYMAAVPDGDFMLILDNDEQLCGTVGMIGDMMTKMKSENILTCWILELLPTKSLGRPRLLMKRDGMRYVEKHDRIELDNVNIIANDYEPRIEMWAIKFSHHHEDRVDRSVIDKALKGAFEVKQL